jgi:hypothetical protein
MTAFTTEGMSNATEHDLKTMEGGVPRSVGRLLYASPNGDRWYLVRDSAGVAVVHVPNESSGGQVERMEVGDFLCRDGNGPERQEMVRLIGTLAQS